MINITFTTEQVIDLITLVKKELIEWSPSSPSEDDNKNFETDCYNKQFLLLQKLQKTISKKTNEDGLWYVVNKIGNNSKTFAATKALKKIFKEHGKCNQREREFTLSNIKKFLEINESHRHGVTPCLDYNVALEVYLELTNFDYVCELVRVEEIEFNDNYAPWPFDQSPFDAPF